MKKEELISSLIANENTQFTDDDSEFLNGLEVAQLERLVPDDNTDGAVPTAEEIAAREAAATEEQRLADEAAAASTENQAVTTEQYIANAPDDIQAVLNTGVAMHKQRKDQIVAVLLENTRNNFTKEQLEAKALDELENIAALSNVVTFEANGPTPPVDNESNEHFTPAAPLLDNLAQQG